MSFALANLEQAWRALGTRPNAQSIVLASGYMLDQVWDRDVTDVFKRFSRSDAHKLNLILLLKLIKHSDAERLRWCDVTQGGPRAGWDVRNGVE